VGTRRDITARVCPVAWQACAVSGPPSKLAGLHPRGLDGPNSNRGRPIYLHHVDQTGLCSHICRAYPQVTKDVSPLAHRLVTIWSDFGFCVFECTRTRRSWAVHAPDLHSCFFSSDLPVTFRPDKGPYTLPWMTGDQR
jgi:hypothetical protein